MSGALLRRRRTIIAMAAGGGSGGGAKAFVQKTTLNASTGVTTQTTTLTGATAHNLLIALSTWDMNAGSGNPTINASSTGWQQAVQAGPVVSSNNGAWITGASIFYKQDAAAGSNALQLDFANTARVQTIIIEVSGNTTSGSLDKLSSSTTTSAATVTATTAATTWATEIVVAVNAAQFVGSNSNIGMTDPATGLSVSIAVNQDTNTYAAHESSYKIVSATGTQSASWSWTGASESAAAIATFM